jgi:hypothetical protein
MPVYTDPAIVGDKSATNPPQEPKTSTSKTALKNWTAEVDRLLLDDTCGADELLQSLDEINCIPIDATKKKQGATPFTRELPRPKTRRGRGTAPSLECALIPSSKKAPEDGIQRQKPVGGNKLDHVSTHPVRSVGSKSTVAVKKGVRFIDVSTKSVSQDVGDSPERGCPVKLRLTTDVLVYDEKELGMIDQIEKEFGIK